MVSVISYYVTHSPSGWIHGDYKTYDRALAEASKLLAEGGGEVTRGPRRFLDRTRSLSAMRRDRP